MSFEWWVNNPWHEFKKKVTPSNISKSVINIGVFGVFLLLIGLPLMLFIWGSFWTTIPGMGGGFTLSGYEALFSDRVYRSIWNTVVFAVVGLIVAVGLATLFTFYTHKIKGPGGVFIPAVIIALWLMPGYLLALAWEIYAGPTGVLTELLSYHPLLERLSPNVRSPIGMGFVAGTNYAGLIYLLVSGAILTISREVEEAAIMSGASTIDIFRKVSIPLTLPSFAIASVLVFASLIQLFDIPLVLGLPGGNFVVAVLIFIEARDVPPNFAISFALGMMILFVALTGLFLQQRLTEDREKFETLGSQSPEVLQHEIKFGKLFSLLVWGIIILIYVLPILFLVLASFSAGYTFDLFAMDFHLENWKHILVGPLSGQFFSAWSNTLIFGPVAAFLTMLLCSAGSYIITKSNSKLKVPTDYLTLSPAGIPGIVIAITFLWIIVGFGLAGKVNSLFFIFIGMSIGGIVYGSRATNASFRSIESELEEAGEIFGASFHIILAKIYGPLVVPGFFSGFVIVFILYLKILSIPILLTISESEQLIQVLVWVQMRELHMGITSALGVSILFVITVFYLAIYYFTDLKLTRI